MYSHLRGSGVYSKPSLWDGKKHDSRLNDNNNHRIFNAFNSSSVTSLWVTGTDVSTALALARPGTSGGLDLVVAEMLHTFPWHVVVFFHRLFSERCRLHRDFDAGSKDVWRHYLASWIRKDRESYQLSSFRPIVQSSVFAKWLERICLGPHAERLLLSKFPLWGFRPGLAACQLALASQLALHTALAFASRSALSSVD